MDSIVAAASQVVQRQAYPAAGRDFWNFFGISDGQREMYALFLETREQKDAKGAKWWWRMVRD